MKKVVLLMSVAILTINISLSFAEDCPAGKVRGASSGKCIDATGTCGTNCTYTIDSAGLMTISGSGAMTDYDYFWDDNDFFLFKDSHGNLAPGYKYGMDLREVTFAPGSNITTIGQGFLDGTYITGITIPDSVRSIGANGLYTNSLESLVIPATVEYIGDDAIYGKNNMNIIMTDATDITDISFSFGMGRNLTITCIGSQEGCDELVNKSGGLIKSYTLGDEDQCKSSSKHYYTGKSCERIPSDGSSLVCSKWYVEDNGECVVDAEFTNDGKIIIDDDMEPIDENIFDLTAQNKENIKVICRGDVDKCEDILSAYPIPIGSGSNPGSATYGNFDGKISAADSSNCESSRYYWSGSSCNNKSGGINCDENFKQMETWCNRIRYTPADAAKVLKDADNEIVMTFKVNR